MPVPGALGSRFARAVHCIDAGQMQPGRLGAMLNTNLNEHKGVAMHNVLVPFDGSASAKRAVQYLVDFSKVYPDIQVHLLNVQREPNLYGNYVPASMLDDLRKGAIQHAEKVNREAALLLEQAGISHQSHVAVGDVVTEVVAAVKRLGCNTVVMGTRGMGSLGNLVMGSVATRVVHDVPVPVLLVK